MESKTEIWKINADFFSKNKIQPLEYQRRISVTWLKELRARILESKGIPDKFVVNKKGGVIHLIDGVHRFEVLREIISKEYIDEMEIKVEVYEGLSDTEMKKLYFVYNNRKKHTLDDIWKAKWSDIPFCYKLLDGDFPIMISPYGSKNMMSAKTFFQALKTAKDLNTLGVSIQPFPLVNWASNLTIDDYKAVKTACSAFVTLYGDYQKSNPYFRPGNYLVLLDIWYKNGNQFNTMEMTNDFMKLRGNDMIVNCLGNSGEVRTMLRRNLIEKLNTKRTKNKYR